MVSGIIAYLFNWFVIATIIICLLSTFNSLRKLYLRLFEVSYSHFHKKSYKNANYMWTIVLIIALNYAIYKPFRDLIIYMFWEITTLYSIHIYVIQ